MESIISVHNLSKRYYISRSKRFQYKTFSETFSTFIKKTSKKILHPLSKGRTSDSVQEFWALKDIDFKLQHGDKIGIIGRNGAGKSTLLKILSRITHPTTGLVRINGRVSCLLEVGTGFSPELTGRENIFLNGAILGMKKYEIKKKFDAIVAFSEVEEFLDTPVKRYSSGMYVRLAFSVAAHLEPEIFIVDEVLAVGDIAFQKKCIGKMEEVGKEGRTILFVSHNLAMVKNLCTKGLLLNRGRIHQVGDINEVVKSYLNYSDDIINGSNQGCFELWDKKSGHKNEQYFQKIVLFNDEGLRSSFEMNKKFGITITISMLKNIPNAEIGIIIKDKNGKWLTSLTTEMLGGIPNSLRSDINNITFLIERLILTKDNYYIDVSLAERGIGRVEYIENAASFTVNSNDIYKTGYEVTSYFGNFFLDAEMKIS
jgi:lipopolysaccharide transport system ATP-binding protein